MILKPHYIMKEETIIESTDRFYYRYHMMKKIFCLSAFIFTLSLALPVSAQSQTHDSMPLTTGYTENGVYYEIYSEYTYIQRSGVSLLITREVVYASNTVPPREIPWQKRINSLTYTGTLHLKNSAYDPKTNKTTATYQGIVTPQ